MNNLEKARTLRKLDRTRKTAKLHITGAVALFLFAIAVVVMWFFAISWGLSNGETRNVTGPMAGMIIGLIVLSILGIIGVVGGAGIIDDALKGLGSAQEEYQDLLDREVAFLDGTYSPSAQPVIHKNLKGINILLWDNDTGQRRDIQLSPAATKTLVSDLQQNLAGL